MVGMAMSGWLDRKLAKSSYRAFAVVKHVNVMEIIKLAALSVEPRSSRLLSGKKLAMG
jgi:hypothetical protein